MPTATNLTVNADGTPLAESDESSDDSFGTQVILKNKEKLRTFFVSGDASVFYTSNVALTRRGTMDDVFAVVNTGVSWMPRLAPGLEAQLAAHASIFRYNRASELDFANLGLGVGLFWTPNNFGGVALFAHYDFIELIDRHSEEILNDHQFTVGAQRVFSFGRCHSLTVGGTSMGGITDPESARRQQLGLFFGYRVQWTRVLESELFYRAAGHFYDAVDRNDFNQILSWNLRYRFASWGNANVFISYGENRSDDSAFDYDVATLGGGAGITLRF